VMARMISNNPVESFVLMGPPVRFKRERLVEQLCGRILGGEGVYVNDKLSICSDEGTSL
jgi:hypothetical protein